MAVLSEFQESSWGLLFLYGCRIGLLDDVGASLIDGLRVDKISESELLPVECLLTFVQGLIGAKNGVKEKVERPLARIKTKALEEPNPEKCSSVPREHASRACSHVLRNGFFHQHWYNW